MREQVPNVRHRTTIRVATDADTVSGSEGRRRLALDKSVRAPWRGSRQGKIWDLVLAEASIAVAILLITYEDGTGGNRGGSVAPRANPDVVAPMVVSRVAERVTQKIDRLAMARESGLHRMRRRDVQTQPGAAAMQ